MKIEIELKGFGGYGWKVCQTCPCFLADEFGVSCSLGFFYDQQDFTNCIIDITTGKLYDESCVIEGDVYSAWRRPQECIEKHGR